MDKIDKRYWAGLFDGEGWISIRPQSINRKRTSINIQVGVAMTCPLPRLLEKEFGGSVYIEKETKKHKRVYRWSLHGKKAISNFLKKIYPHLKVKQKQAKIMLDFIDIRTVSGRERTSCDIKLAKRYINKIRVLNGKVRRKDVYHW